MRIERIGGSRLDTDSEDQTTWELMWAGEVAMRKSIPALRQAGYESISEVSAECGVRLYVFSSAVLSLLCSCL